MTEAQRMLGLLGENGENWTKGTFHNERNCMCFLGAFTDQTPLHATDRMEKFKLLAASVAMAVGRPMTCWKDLTKWNDDPATTWPDIKLALDLYHDAELALQPAGAGPISPP